jgi:hypothetical protein
VTGIPRKLLTLAVGTALACSQAYGATEAERIQALEAQLKAQKAMMAEQQRMLEAMQQELQQLKADKTPTAMQEETLAQAEEPAPMQPAAKEQMSIDFYGHIQLDAIYDFDRVDPTWESTLRPSTIPTVDGTFGGDGNTIVSVKQTQMGFRSDIPTAMGNVKSLTERSIDTIYFV